MLHSATPALVRQGDRYLRSLPSIGNLRHGDRIAALPPPMVTLPRTVHLPPVGTDLKTLAPSQHGFLFYAPYMVAETPQCVGGSPCRNDSGHMDTTSCNAICMFAKYNEIRELTAFLVCHVNDILLTVSEAELLVSEKVLRTFRDVEIEKLTPKTPIVFNGVLLGRPGATDWDIHSPKSHFANELQKGDFAQFAQQENTQCAETPGGATASFGSINLVASDKTGYWLRYYKNCHGFSRCMR